MKKAKKKAKVKNGRGRVLYVAKIDRDNGNVYLTRRPYGPLYLLTGVDELRALGFPALKVETYVRVRVTVEEVEG